MRSVVEERLFPYLRADLREKVATDAAASSTMDQEVIGGSFSEALPLAASSQLSQTSLTSSGGEGWGRDEGRFQPSSSSQE